MKNTILIVDDKGANRAALREMFNDKYEIIEATDGIDALKSVRDHIDEIIMILLDVKMPNMNGFDVMHKLKGMNLIGRIPVIMITAMEQDDLKSVGYNLGASDYIIKPFEPVVVVKRVENVIQLFKNMNNLENKVVMQNEKLHAQSKVIKDYTDRMTDILCTLVEYRNLDYESSITRVKEITRVIAECVMNNCPEYQLNEEMVEHIIRAAGLHDIGKIAIPDNILMKPGKLTDKEFEMIMSHTTKGAEFIEKIGELIGSEKKKIYMEVCRSHHERVDGTGYPDGLRDEDIPISAQIIGLADTYDALTRDRVYNKAMSKESAYAMIVGGECGAFSMKMLNCLKKVKVELSEL